MYNSSHIPSSIFSSIKLLPSYFSVLSTASQFPNVNRRGLKKEEEAALLTRLYEDLERVKSSFSLLVTKTLQSLKAQNLDFLELKSLVRSYCMPKSKISKLFSKKITLNELFIKLNDYWSFFDYELLALFISAYCTELDKEKNEYIATFNAYCNRKVSEAPTDFKSKTRGIHFTIKVKIGGDFDHVSLEELKKLQATLRKVTKLDLSLLEVSEGCIVVVFESFTEEDSLQLSEKEKNELFKMGVLKLYDNNNYVYFECQDSARRLTPILPRDSGYYSMSKSLLSLVNAYKTLSSSDHDDGRIISVSDVGVSEQQQPLSPPCHKLLV